MASKYTFSLVDKELDTGLEDGEKNMENDEIKKLDKKALTVLHLNLADNVLKQVCGGGLLCYCGRKWKRSMWTNVQQILPNDALVHDAYDKRYSYQEIY